MGGAVAGAGAQDIDDPALCDLSLESCEKLEAFGSRFRDSKLFDDLRLCCLQEREKFIEIDSMIAVVVFCFAFDVGEAAID